MSQLNSRRLYLHALTPLHSGVGQAAAIVDLPIAREKSTGWPVLPGSGLKGVLRARLKSEKGEEAAKAIFGSPEGAGPITFTDLRILCLPVRSFFGTFAWVTSPLALERFARDANALGDPISFEAPSLAETALVSSSALLDPAGEKLLLEDLDLGATVDESAVKIATAIGAEVFGEDKNGLLGRFAIVPDGVFDFLCETGTEIIGRTAINDEGVAQTGSLRYEEAVPAEAIFCGWAVQTREADTAGFWESLRGKPTLQIGGNSSVGRGLCRLAVRP